MSYVQNAILAGVPPQVVHPPSLDARIDEFMPGPHQAWRTEDQEAFALRTIGLLLEEATEVLGEFRQTIATRGGVHQLSHVELEYLAETLGWVLGWWRGAVSFEYACKLFGVRHRSLRESIAEGFAAETPALRAYMSGQMMASTGNPARTH